jgi:DNA-binding Lrp family transcriptional regulator
MPEQASRKRGRSAREPPLGGDALELAPRLSTFDRGLIRALQEDGRRSYRQIGRELNVAERTVRMRVNELRAAGVIEITTVADPRLMGYSLIALVGVCVHSGDGLAATARLLSQISGAFYVVVVTGRYNILVELSCVDTDQLLAVIDDEILAVPGVTSVEVLPYLRLHYQNPAFEAATRKSRNHGPADHPEVKFEGIDREIISRLHDDGRTPFQTMARDLGVSESQIRARVRRLTSSQAVRVMALTIPRGVGFETVALAGLNVTPGVPIEAVANRLSALPSIIYVAICSGRFDILAEVVCTDRQALLDLLDHDVRTVEGVSGAESWIYLDLLYRSVQPAQSTQS